MFKSIKTNIIMTVMALFLIGIVFDNNETDQIYLPPNVARLEEESLEDGKPTKLSIIDGSQRIKALSQLEALLFCLSYLGQ